MLAIVASACTSGDGAAAVVLPPTTKVLDDASLDAIDSADDGAVTFSAGTEVVSSLEAGDVVVAGVSEHTPGGLMRTVTSIDEAGGGVTVTTTGAALDEAIESGHVEYADELDLADVELDHPDTFFADGLELGGTRL